VSTHAPSPRTPLSRERIVAAALRLIDERGLSGLSMRRLGAELGVEAMSLYKHVEGKEAVLDGVRALLLAELEAATPPPGDSWRDDLAGFARRYRALGRAHPEAFTLLARGADRAYVAGRGSVESSLRGLQDAGFGEEDAALALRSVVRYVLGFGLIDMAGEDAPDPLSAADLDALTREKPRTAGLMRSLGPGTEEALFDFGLAALIDGIAARVPGVGAHSPGAAGRGGSRP
jgi:AcrR family transcriptional regulator